MACARWSCRVRSASRPRRSGRRRGRAWRERACPRCQAPASGVCTLDAGYGLVRRMPAHPRRDRAWGALDARPGARSGKTPARRGARERTADGRRGRSAPREDRRSGRPDRAVRGLAFERLPRRSSASRTASPTGRLFAALLKANDHKGPAEIEPKRAWTFRQIHWLAHRAGIADRHAGRAPVNPIALARLAWAARRRPRRRAARPARTICATSGAAAPMPSRPRLAALAATLAPTADPAGDAVKQRLRDATDAALARGVFGVPTLGIDDKLFGARRPRHGRGLCARRRLVRAPHWQREGAPRPA